MKNIQTFDDFINESYLNDLNEAIDISSDLANVKTPADLKAAVGNKTLIIMSKHDATATSMKKRGGDWPMLHFVRGLDTNYIKIDNIGSFGKGSYLDLEYIAYDRTGWSKNWTLEEIFDFFLFNKKRGNRIYTVDELPIRKEVKHLLDIRKSNMDKLRTLLGSSVQVTNKTNVGSSKYVVWSELRNQHGREKIEFTSNGKDYTYFFSVYGSDLPKIDSGRSTARGGYSEQTIFAVNKKSADEIIDLLQSNIDVMKEAMKVAQNFYAKEKVTAAK